MEVHWGELDGVTTLSVDEGVIPDPLRAALVFGVGRCDETMAVSGICHAVEHLALRGFGATPFAWNGMADSTTTRFVVSGRDAQVIDFLHGVTRSLRDLPVDRLADEVRVMRVEDQRRGASQVGSDLRIRFGARGAGLFGWPEHGLGRLSPDEVRAWAETWFTAANAVLWTSGPVPRGLSLDALLRGPAPERLPPPPSIPAARTFVPEPTRFVSLSVLDDHVGPAMVTAGIARQRAFDRLRQRDAISYAIELARVSVGGGRSLVLLQADATETAYAAVLDGLTQVVDELAENGPTEGEWDLALQSYGQQLEHPEYRVSSLETDAERHLLGLRFMSDDELDAKVRALTLESLRDALRAVMPTLLAVGPREIGETVPGWNRHEPWSLDVNPGREYRPVTGRERGTLVTGDDAVSWVDDDDLALTIRWDEAVACFTFDNGVRTVLGPTGVTVSVVPWCWRGGKGLTERVDAAIGPDRRIRLGEGETTYLADDDDAESTTDVRWLGSLVGARYQRRTVDVVITTDGVLLVEAMAPAASVHHQRSLRSRPVEALLAREPWHRWIPVEDIVLAYVVGRAVKVRFGRVMGTLTICVHDDKDVEVALQAVNQLPHARHALSALLGHRFEG